MLCTCMFKVKNAIYARTNLPTDFKKSGFFDILTY
jgi:hypothetical protein